MTPKNSQHPLPRKRKVKASENHETRDFISDLTLPQLQLIVLENLQKSLNVDELLSLFIKSLPADFCVESVTFLPKFHPKSLSEKIRSPQQRKLKLFTGNEYIGQLVIKFTSVPSDIVLSFIREASKLIAFPLKHALNFETALHLTEYDHLTKLKNKKALDSSLLKACNAFHRYAIPLSLMILDIDHFKKINDTYGHLDGDKVIQTLSQLIRQSCRLSDEAFRFGGEEFVMLLHNTNLQGAFETAERLREAVAINCFGEIIDEKDMPITVSIGICEFKDGMTPADLLENADQALYEAKKNGRNQTQPSP